MRRVNICELRYQAVLDRLKDLHPRLIDLSLDRIRRLLAALGDPQDALPPVVHVAGTNGKGSLIACLKAMVEAAGLAAHVYTSPHLVRFNERIAVGGAAIADDALTAILEECETANAGQPITYFEITTAAAYLAFSRAPADVVLLETGLGGRFDATNVIDTPALCAITPVSMDHMQFLGDDVAAIAFEKAGILKPGVACITAPQDPAASSVIEARAMEVGAPLVQGGRDWRVEKTPHGFSYVEDGARLDLPPPALVGAHQIINAATAIACARHLPDLKIGEPAITAGVGAAHWPARLQRLDRGRLADIAGPGWELWLDGGHNRAAAEALAHTAEGWRDRPLHLVFGAMNTRDPADFLAPFAGLAAAVRAVAIPGEENSHSAEDVAAAARKADFDAAPAAGLVEALGDIVNRADKPGRILICGSLYLAGTALAMDDTN